NNNKNNNNKNKNDYNHNNYNTNNNGSGPLDATPAASHRRWRQEPLALSCNATGFDPRWSRFRHRLQQLMRVSGGTLPQSLPADLLVQAGSLVGLRPMQQLQMEQFKFAAELNSGAMLLRNWALFGDRFCLLGHISALFVLAWHAKGALLGGPKPQVVADLEAMAFTLIPMGFWVLLDMQVWPISAVAIADLIEDTERRSMAPIPGTNNNDNYNNNRNWRMCPCSSVERLGPPSVLRPPRRLQSQRSSMKVAMIANHNYIFDVALGLLEAASALAPDGGTLSLSLLGYVLGVKFELAAKNCEMAAGITCRRHARLERLTSLLSEAADGYHEHHANVVVDGDGVEGQAHPITLKNARAELAASWHESPELREADLVVCGYPYPACYMIDDVPLARGTPLLLPLQGTVVSEYVDVGLHPWVQETLKRWLRPELVAEPKESDLGHRWVMTMNYIEHTWVERILGPVQFLPLGGRHMRQLVAGSCGSRTAGPNLESNRVLMHKFTWAAVIPDATAMRLFADDHVRRGAAGKIELVWTHRGLDVWELLNFKAIVMIPWDWEITTFVELYRMGLPLFIPDEGFMQALIWQIMRKPALRFQQRFIRFRRQWWEGASCHLQPTAPCGEPSEPQLPPWLDAEHPSLSMREQIAGWFQDTDYSRMPHVHRFTGLSDLASQLGSFRPHDTVELMAKENAAALKTSASMYESILSSI
ncbi:unnamed protein product, partial [Polarella glacialis]